MNRNLWLLCICFVLALANLAGALRVFEFRQRQKALHGIIEEWKAAFARMENNATTAHKNTLEAMAQAEKAQALLRQNFLGLGLHDDDHAETGLYRASSNQIAFAWRGVTVWSTNIQHELKPKGPDGFGPD